MEGRDGVVVPLSLQQDWSQLPDEILGIIFSYLPRKCDLLNGRLVCRSWSQECLRVMKKPDSEFCQTLSESNITQYIQFVQDGNNGCLTELNTIPFHVNINFNILHSKDTDNPCYKTKLDILTENVKYLCTTFGKECVVKFTSNTPRTIFGSGSGYDFTRFWLIEFLVLISPGIKILDLSDFHMQLGLYVEDEIKSTELYDLTFPKLKTIICSKWKFLPGEFQIFGRYSTGNRRNSHTIYPYIIDRSPNIENLERMNAQDLIPLSVNYDKLITLLSEDMIKEPSKILEKFLQSSSPKLQKLAFSLEYDYNTPHDWTLNFYRILESVSSTLVSLTVTTMETERTSHPFNDPRNRMYWNGIGTGRASLMSFPRLPNLKHLRIYVNIARITEDLIFYDPEEINFYPETLPSLKSVELPLGFLLTPHSDRHLCLKEEFEVPVKFSTVTELTLCMKHTRWSVWMSEIGEFKGAGALKHLQKVFPDVSKLSIVNESIDIQEQQGIKYLLHSLIQSPLSISIQDICIDEFGEDFLGQVLGQLDPIPCGEGECVDSDALGVQAWPYNSFCLTSIRKIRLGLSKISPIAYLSQDHLPVSVPNLTVLVKWFPSLQIIEISEVLFRGMTETERKDLIQTLTTTFPYLWIHRY